MLPGSYFTLGGPGSKPGLHDKMTANNRLRYGNHEIHMSQNWAHISQLTGSFHFKVQTTSVVYDSNRCGNTDNMGTICRHIMLNLMFV